MVKLNSMHVSLCIIITSGGMEKLPWSLPDGTRALLLSCYKIHSMRGICFRIIHKDISGSLPLLQLFKSFLPLGHERITKL